MSDEREAGMTSKGSGASVPALCDGLSEFSVLRECAKQHPVCAVLLGETGPARVPSGEKGGTTTEQVLGGTDARGVAPPYLFVQDTFSFSSQGCVNDGRVRHIVPLKHAGKP